MIGESPGSGVEMVGEKEALSEGVSERRFRTLIVDDNHDAADSLAMLMVSWGIEARTAYDGFAALNVAATFHPDCFVLDISMPGMDGYSLARTLRESHEFRTVPLVALSAFSGSDHLSRVRAAGFDADRVELEAVEQLARA